jgi:hypothetical protein
VAPDEDSRFGRYANKTRDGYESEKAAINEWVADRGALPLAGITVALIIGFILAIFHVIH